MTSANTSSDIAVRHQRPDHGLPPPSLTRRLLDACTQDWGAEDSAGRVCFWADLVLSVVRPRPEVRPLSITVAFDSGHTG